MKKVIGMLAIVMFMVSVMAISSAQATETEGFTQITAQEAYNMVEAGDAKLIDVRTTAEFLWVGTCKLPDGTTPYNIPWKIWAYRFSGTDGKVKAGGIVVKRLFGTLIQRTFPDKNTPLILMCRSGHRSSAAADYLVNELGYTTIYEIDNVLKEEADEAEGTEVSKRGGRGGFQGSSSNSKHCFGETDPKASYRGYPNRLELNVEGNPLGDYCYYETDSSKLEDGTNYKDKNVSVSWMDTGLPITQTVDKNKIWLYMWK